MNMGPLQLNRDDLIKELSSFEPAGGSGSTAASPDKSVGASIAAAAIPAVINLISNLWTNRRNENLARLQNQWNIEQWNRENAYNNPSAQLARLAGAGINPALAYANGDLMNEAAASPQMTSARVTSPIQIDPLTAAQIENLTSQAEKNRSEIPVNEQHANELKASASHLSALAEKVGIDNQFAAQTLAMRVASQLAKDQLSETEARENLKYVQENVHNEYERLKEAAEEAHNKNLISYQQYLEAQELVKQAQAATSIAEFREDMKELDYWWEKGDDVLRHLENIVGLFIKFRIPIPQTITVDEYVDENGVVTGGRVRTTKKSS